MRIVADEDILSVQESFSLIGELISLPGRKISRQDLVNADALLVRSITTVDENLLQGTAVRFVGTVTSGIDHVDVKYLTANDKGFRNYRKDKTNWKIVVITDRRRKKTTDRHTYTATCIIKRPRLGKKNVKEIFV